MLTTRVLTASLPPAAPALTARDLVGSGPPSGQQRAGAAPPPAPTTRVQLTYGADSHSTTTHFSSSR
jgi:hypothetical protein